MGVGSQVEKGLEGEGQFHRVHLHRFLGSTSVFNCEDKVLPSLLAQLLLS